MFILLLFYVEGCQTLSITSQQTVKQTDDEAYCAETLETCEGC